MGPEGKHQIGCGQRCCSWCCGDFFFFKDFLINLLKDQKWKIIFWRENVRHQIFAWHDLIKSVEGLPMGMEIKTAKFCF